MSGWDILRWGSLALGGTVGAGILARGLYRAGLHVYDDLSERWVKHRQDRLTLAHIETQNELQNIRAIPADERGRYPLLYGAGGILRDPNNLRAFTIATVLETWPGLEKLDAVIRAVIGAGGWPTPATAQAMLPGPEAVADLPTRVPLSGLLDGPPSWRDLVLGVAAGTDGKNAIVRGDLSKMVHVAVGGSSGWGKSMFLRSAAWQMANSTDPVDLAMIDLEHETLAPFGTCKRLLWPVADTETGAAAILRELTQELDRRKALFAAYPGCDSLDTYNQRAGEYLSPVILICDEATALLENKDIEAQIRTLSLRARKYGVWLWLAGQDWKSSTLDTAIRNQLSTRVQFKAMSASQSRVLLQVAGAEEFQHEGRALAWIPGRDLITMQTPLVNRAMLDGLRGAGPQGSMPKDGRSETERIQALGANGLSQRQIEMAVFGYAGGAAHTKVTQALGATTVADPSATALGDDLDEFTTVVAEEEE